MHGGKRQLIRLGIIGLGKHLAGRLLPNILASPHLLIVAGCDIDPSARRAFGDKFPHLPLFSTGYDLITKSSSLNLDAVIVSTHPQDHVQSTAQALSEGLHVFVEKPPAISADDLLPLAQLAEEKGLTTLVGTMWRYSRAVTLFHDWQREATGRAVQFLALTALFPAGVIRPSWGLEPDAVVFYERVLHAVDLAAALIGNPDSVRTYSAAGPIGACGTNGRSSLILVLGWLSGKLATLQVHTGSYDYGLDVRMILADGSHVTLDGLEQLSITTQPSWIAEPAALQDRPSLNWRQGRLYLGYGRQGYAEELEQFAKSITTGEPAPTNLREAATVLHTLQIGLQSLERGEEVSSARGRFGKNGR